MLVEAEPLLALRRGVSAVTIFSHRAELLHLLREFRLGRGGESNWEMSEDHLNVKPARLSRRGMLDLLLSGSFASLIAAVLYPVLRYIAPPPSDQSVTTSVVAAQVNAVPLNSGLVFRFGTRPGILVHTSSGEWRAFSAVCTHLQCTVQYRPDLEQIWCACHNGHFDLSGKNVSGPPPRPLEQYDVSLRGNDVVVSVHA
jgi:Rieske Fe-S protein